MGKIYLVRHGHIEKRYDGTYYGITDVALSEGGKKQSDLVIKHLSGKGVQRIYSSPLQRARLLAEKAAKKWKADLKLVKNFQEMDFGEWEGLTYAEIKERFPKRMKSFLFHPHRVRLGGGENMSDLFHRVIPEFRRIARKESKNDIAIIAHASPIRAIICDILRAPMRSYFRLGLNYAAISVVENWGEEFAVLKYNYTDHLGDLVIP